jgi:hypothetical protein
MMFPILFEFFADYEACALVEIGSGTITGKAAGSIASSLHINP